MPEVRLLSLDWSDGDDGVSTLDAWASTQSASTLAEAEAEARAVLAWLEAEFPGQRGPEEEGGRWDAELAWHAEPGGWQNLALTITAVAEVVEVLRTTFDR